MPVSQGEKKRRCTLEFWPVEYLKKKKKEACDCRGGEPLCTAKNSAKEKQKGKTKSDGNIPKSGKNPHAQRAYHSGKKGKGTILKKKEAQR